MKRLLFVTTFTCVLAHATGTTSVWGIWKITRILDWSMIGIDPVDSKKLIGKRVEIGKQGFQFEGLSCRPTFDTQIVDRDKTLKDDARLVDNKTLGLPKRVRQIDLDCFHMLMRDETHAVIDWEGAMYELVEQQPAPKR